MAVPYLPLEIVEEIIDMLVGDRTSLRSCSLVSASWVHRSRHHLFANIKLHSLSDLQTWSRIGLGPSSNHVRVLDLAQNEELKWIIPDSLAGIFNDFTSFNNVQSLTLTGLDLTLFDECSLTRFFGHLSEHLTSLTVLSMTAHPDALLFFVCMFPKLDDLSLDYLAIGKATIPYRKPAVTPRFRGKLALSNIKSNGSSMIASFVDPPLPMAFQDVCVVDCRFGTPKPLKDLFVACQATMKKIKVSKIFLGEFPLRGSSHHCPVSPEFLRIRYLLDDISQTPLIDLSPCKGLEEMRLSLIQLRQPSHWIEPILQTVTSAHVRKITFETDFPIAATDIDSGINISSWSRLDAIFLRMADTLDQTGEKLELIFNALAPNTLGELSSVDPGRFLEKCRAKATVRFERI